MWPNAASVRPSCRLARSESQLAGRRWRSLHAQGDDRTHRGRATNWNDRGKSGDSQEDQRRRCERRRIVRRDTEQQGCRGIDSMSDAAISPTTMPSAANVNVRRRTNHITRRGVAPSAMRTPNSGVRRATVNDSRP